jgi:hypothetical protein
MCSVIGGAVMNEKNGYETHLLSQKKSYGTINQFRPEYLIY